MATCLTVITTARRKLLGDKRTPGGTEGDTLLASLQALYRKLANEGLFGSLTPVLVSSDYEARENEQITKVGSPTITYPTSVTVCGVARAPLDMAVVLVAGETPDTRIYDANLASWISIEALALADAAPLSDRFDIASILAVDVSPEYTEPTAILFEQAADARRALGRVHHNRVTFATTDWPRWDGPRGSYLGE